MLFNVQFTIADCYNEIVSHHATTKVPFDQSKCFDTSYVIVVCSNSNKSATLFCNICKFKTNSKFQKNLFGLTIIPLVYSKKINFFYQLLPFFKLQH